MALITAIFIAMGQFNHAIHFYIYTLTGAVFRNELIKLFTLSKRTLLKKKKSRLNHRNNYTERTTLHSTANNNNQIDIHEF
jgi:hypothetical protein